MREPQQGHSWCTKLSDVEVAMCGFRDTSLKTILNRCCTTGKFEDVFWTRDARSMLPFGRKIRFIVFSSSFSRSREHVDVASPSDSASPGDFMLTQVETQNSI